MRGENAIKSKNTFIAEACRWIRFNTVSRHSNEAFASYLRQKFQAVGFRVRLRKYRGGGQSYYNLIAWKGPSGSRPLLLNTHLDTVPAGPEVLWTSTGGDPWRARLRGGRLYGLGVADVKLNLLCQWEALRGFDGQSFRRPLCVVGTFGEEVGQVGAGRLLEDWSGPRPSLALVGEPSELRPIHSHRGYIVFELTLFPRDRARVAKNGLSMKTQGRSAHSSTPHLGENALEKMLAVLLKMERAGKNPRVTDFHGGTATNQVPSEAFVEIAEPGKVVSRVVPLIPWQAMSAVAKRLSREIRNPLTWNWGRASLEKGAFTVFFDVRYPPSADAGKLIRRIARAVSKSCRSEQTKFFLDVEHHNPALAPRIPMSSRRIVEETLRRSGLPSRWDAKATCTEAGQYQREGIPALVFGPGRSVGNIHRPNESIAVADLHRAVRFYRTLIELWCQPNS